MDFWQQISSTACSSHGDSLLLGAGLNAVERLSSDSLPALCQRQNVDVLIPTMLQLRCNVAPAMMALLISVTIIVRSSILVNRPRLGSDDGTFLIAPLTPQTLLAPDFSDEDLFLIA